MRPSSDGLTSCWSTLGLRSDDRLGAATSSCSLAVKQRSRSVDADRYLAHAVSCTRRTSSSTGIVGLPGDHGGLGSGGASINGDAGPWKPLCSGAVAGHLEITVPEDRYLILPTTSVASRQRLVHAWKDVGLIAARQNSGTALPALSPLSRFWFIR